MALGHSRAMGTVLARRLRTISCPHDLSVRHVNVPFGRCPKSPCICLTLPTGSASRALTICDAARLFFIAACRNVRAHWPSRCT